VAGANAEAEANRRERIAVFMVEGREVGMDSIATTTKKHKERMLDGPVDVSSVNTFEAADGVCSFHLAGFGSRAAKVQQRSFKFQNLAMTYVTHTERSLPASSERNPRARVVSLSLL
jgi:hypothetical protein